MIRKVLLIDDEASILDSLGQALELASFDVLPLNDPSGLEEILERGFDGVVLSDVRMPGEDGLAVLARIKAHDPDIPVVLMTGHGDVRMAVAAMRDGAFDFIEKPFRPELAINILRHACRVRQAGQAGAVRQDKNEPSRHAHAHDSDSKGADAEHAELDDVLATAISPRRLEQRLIGSSSPIRALRTQLLRYASLNADVLITGETGTGKEVVARALHDFGLRSGANFVAINCGALPAELVGSELFGHEPGAFTGARARRIGKFEFADGGTVFLDEIESMPMSLQTELLRVLQERRFCRLGGNQEVSVDIRVIAASKVDLRVWVEQGRFREDLYYRLSVLLIEVPPLRERGADIAGLFEHFVRTGAEQVGHEPPDIATSVTEALMERAWPGNIRELQNAALRYVLDQGDARQADQAEPQVGGGLSLAERLAAFEATLVQQALDRHGGDLAGTENELGISRRTLHEKIRRYKLTRRRDDG